ncbi:unnamed protein product [Arctia plantaginis]|uniref:Uncharacterized protein n=1 Tax=Arctia plantaginis TaxID=874455 RepID=A0A8S1AAH4_ARCPL|nr:unnamed protein product [Arctia plantaginis]
MIPNKIRESRRVKALKLPKNLERLYKKGKCRECAVVVTRMDFAKILGKFTKVKIQYESSKTPKTKQNSEVTSPNTNARLKSNENGMILIHRNAKSQQPVKEVTASKKTKTESPRVTHNILKENNRLKKVTASTTLMKDKNSYYDDKKKMTASTQKQYVVVFEDPVPHSNNNKDVNSKVSLSDLLSQINDSILPSKDWCIDFFPKKGEPKDDKVYDRIAAELEDLMYSEKPTKPIEKMDTAETKVDDFPSIMDILNDNSSDSKTNDQSSSLDFKSNLESSDVEAMLLGKTNSSISTPLPPTPMDVENADMGNLMEDVNHLAVIPDNIVMPETPTKLPASDIIEEVENPQSPSILDETLQKGIEEHLPCNTDKKNDASQDNNLKTDETMNNTDKKEDTEMKPVEANIQQEITEFKDVKPKETISLATIEGITHLVFKKTKDGACFKSVTCPKDLKYDIEIDGKSVEFIGAPKVISNPGDLQVLLEIVNESELSNLHVLH